MLPDTAVPAGRIPRQPGTMSSTLWTIALLAAFIAPSSHGFVAPPPPASSTSRRSTQIFRPAGGAKWTPHVAPNAVAQRLPSDHASLQRNTAGRKSFVQHSVGGEMGVSTSVEGVTTWAEERFPGCSTIVSSVREHTLLQPALIPRICTICIRKRVCSCGYEEWVS